MADMDFQFGLFGNDPMLSASYMDDVLPSFDFEGEDATDPLRASPAPSTSSQVSVIYYSDSDAGAEEMGEPVHKVSLRDHDYGQTRIKEEEVEHLPASPAPVAPAAPQREKRPVRNRRRQKRRRRATTMADTSDDEEEEKEVIFSNGRPKLYAERPFKNPQLERARLNAINAKKNRDRKKQESARMEGEMRALREQNARIKRSLRRFELRAEKAERELEAIKNLLRTANLGDLLKLASDPEE